MVTGGLPLYLSPLLSPILLRQSYDFFLNNQVFVFLLSQVAPNRVALDPLLTMHTVSNRNDNIKVIDSCWTILGKSIMQNLHITLIDLSFLKCIFNMHASAAHMCKFCTRAIFPYFTVTRFWQGTEWANSFVDDSKMKEGRDFEEFFCRFKNKQYICIRKLSDSTDSLI